jgi:hypothetical protein
MTSNRRTWVEGVGVACGAAAAAALIGTVCASAAMADSGDPSATTGFSVADDYLRGSSSSTLNPLDDVGSYLGGTGGSPADSAVAVLLIVTSYPLESLHDASASLTEADQVLGQGASDIAGMTRQIAAQNIALDEIASLSARKARYPHTTGGLSPIC